MTFLAIGSIFVFCSPFRNKFAISGFQTEESNSFDDGKLQDEYFKSQNYTLPLQFQPFQIERLKKIFMSQWSIYKKNAWGYDNFNPLSQTPSNLFNISLSMIEALDTLILMNETEEVKLIEEHLRSTLFQKNVSLSGYGLSSTFIENAIGGLLSASFISNNPSFLQGACFLLTKFPRISEKEIFFTTYMNYNNESKKFEISGPPQLDSHVQGSGPLEILSVFYERQALKNLPMRALSLYQALPYFSSLPGLVYDHFLAYTGEAVRPFTYSLFNNESSFYSNFAKIPYLTNKSTETLIRTLRNWSFQLETQFVRSFNSRSRLLNTLNDTRGFIQNIRTASIPATLIIASKLIPENASHYKELAIKIMDGFIDSLNLNKYMPPYEVKIETNDNNLKETVVNASWDFQPEIFESLFYLYQETKDNKYRNFAWNLIRTINNTCWDKNGFHAIDSEKNPVDHFNTVFYSAFKYIWFLFGGEIPNGEWIFNSKGHLLKVYPSKLPELDTILKNLPIIYNIKYLLNC